MSNVRTCIHPLSDADGNTLYDGHAIVVPDHPEWSEPRGRRLRCGQPVPIGRFDRLCDEHYEPVSDKVVVAYIERVLNG